MTIVENRNGDSADEVLAAHLAAGETQKDAARAAGLSPTTAWRRMTDPAFRERVSAARAVIAAGVTLRAVDLAATAMNTLSELLDAKQPATVRLGAARVVLTVAAEFGERAELTERLAALEAVLNVRPKAA